MTNSIAAAVAVPTTTPAWRQYICRACGYIYDEREGDPDGGLPPGTRYEDIPDDWACPLCGVSKADFDPYVAGSPMRTARLPSNPSAHGWRARREGVVVVGGGTAGWAAARALRAKDPDLPITIVTADSADVYPKPALSLAFGHRQSAADLIASSGADAADELAVRLAPRVHVVAIDAKQKRLRTTHGPIPYDTLVLALGARPIPSTTFPADLCWRINSLDAWTRLHAVLAAAPARVAVIGAGLVGCELADDLAHAGHSVTVFDPAARPLAAWASIDQSARLLDGWSTLGVTFVPRAIISRVERCTQSGEPVTLVHRAGDSSHEVDFVIVAIGLAVDLRLARTAGLAVDHGIAVDPATMVTSDPSIYALGDCVSFDGRPCRFIEPIARQAAAIVASVNAVTCENAPHRAPLVRLKTRSAPMTLDGQRA